MRLRKLAGLMVGAVTAGVVSLPRSWAGTGRAVDRDGRTQALSCAIRLVLDRLATRTLTASVDGTAIAARSPSGPRRACPRS